MLTLQITLPAHRAAPRFFFEMAVKQVLGGMVAVREDGIVPVFPTPDEVSLGTYRLNPWTRANVKFAPYRVHWQPEEWDDFLVSVDRHHDTGAWLMFRPESGFTVRFQTLPVPGGEWHLLALSVQDGVDDPAPMEELMTLFAGRFGLTYAAISGDKDRLRTGWEELLGLRMKKFLPLSREHLRGYNWITYCPRLLLDRVGGIEAAENSGAFHAVREIWFDLVALQATETVAGYGPEQVRRVHEALAGILVPGEPPYDKSVLPRAWNPAYDR